MTIDTATPRTRRALLFGALGGALASVGIMAKAPPVRAGVDGDVVLDAPNTGAGTTEISAASSNPAFRVTGGGVGIQVGGDIGVDAGGPLAVSAVSDGAPGIGVVGWSRVNGNGVIGRSTNGNAGGPPASADTGIYGVAQDGPGSRGVFGLAGAGQGVRGEATTGIGVDGVATDTGIAVAADSTSGLAVRATSTLGHALRGRGQLDGVIGESPGGRSGVVGYSGGGSAPAGPGKTGVYGEATQDTASRGVSGFTLAGQGVRGEAATGQGVAGVATSGGGVTGTATTGNGVLGFSGAGQAPAGPAQVGVYGESNLDAASRAVFGKTTLGQGVRGESTAAGIGVRAVSATGNALDVSGKVKLNRSGRASVAANKTYVDVAVPGGIDSTSMVFATMQILRTGVWVVAARPNWPTAGLLRIYLNKIASTTASTSVAWVVLL